VFLLGVGGIMIISIAGLGAKKYSLRMLYYCDGLLTKNFQIPSRILLYAHGFEQ